MGAGHPALSRQVDAALTLGAQGPRPDQAKGLRKESELEEIASARSWG